MRAGKLRHNITIERRSLVLDALGHESATWKPITSSIPAQVTELSGRELERAKQQVAECSVRILLRFTDCVRTDRIKYGTRTLQVESVTPDERAREITLLCVETI